MCRFRRRVFALFGKRQAQSVAVFPYEIQRHESDDRNDRRRKEDFERRGKARHRRIDVRKPDNQSDQRPDNHRKKYVEAHSHALETSFRARGNIILERRHKRRAKAQNRTQHKDARNVQYGKPCGFGHKLHKVNHKRASDDDRKQRHIKMFSSELVEQYAHNAREHRRADDNDGKRHDEVVAEFQRVLHEVDEIREERLLRDAQNARRKQADVQHAVVFYDLFAEAVKGFFQIIRVLVFDDACAVFHRENRKNTGDDGDNSQNDKEQPVARIRGFIKRSEPYKHDYRRKHGQNRQNGIDLSAVCVVGDVGHPSVERGIVCGRAGKRHNAVEQDKQKADKPQGF